MTRQTRNRGCPPKKVISKDECVSAAVSLNLNFAEFINRSLGSTKWPKGCFMYKSKLFFNENEAARGKCNFEWKNKMVTCLCFQSNKPVQADAPPTIEGAYTEECKTCSVEGVVPKASCYEHARALDVGVNNKEPELMDDLDYPKGCFVISRTLWYNTADSKATCDQTNMRCLCGGGKTVEEKNSGTCAVEDRLTNCDCKKMADKLGKSYSTREYMNDGNYPAGCFIIKKKLWINSNTSSTATCGQVPHGDEATCICAKAR